MLPQVNAVFDFLFITSGKPILMDRMKKIYILINSKHSKTRLITSINEYDTYKSILTISYIKMRHVTVIV